jgi:hypothetical protein
MNIRDLQDRIAHILPDTRTPEAGPMDDLFPFRFASAVFVPPFMDSLVRVVLGADEDGSARTRLIALAAVLEEIFDHGDEDLADALAMRLLHTRLCAQPPLLAGAWPYLGARTQRVAAKFLRLAEECDRREAAVRGPARSPEPAAEPSGQSAMAPSINTPTREPNPAGRGTSMTTMTIKPPPEEEKTAFRKTLEAAVSGKHSQVSPFSLAWSDGRLTKDHFAFWVAQHLHYVGHFSEWLAAMFADCPHKDARDFLLQNMWEEMGTRTPSCSSLRRGVGEPRAILSTPALPSTDGLRFWCENLAKTSFLGAAALIVRLESQTQVSTPVSFSAAAEYGFTGRRPSSSRCTSSRTWCTANVVTRSWRSTRPLPRFSSTVSISCTRRPRCDGPTWMVSTGSWFGSTASSPPRARVDPAPPTTSAT